MNDTNMHETNRKTYNEINLRTMAIGEPLTANDSAVLLSIATQRLTVGGDAVALSRAALFLEIHELPPSAARIGKVPSQLLPVTTRPTIYPNPARDFTTINKDVKAGEILLICDALGIIKSKVKVNKDENEIILNIKQLPPGTYLIKFPNEPKHEALIFSVIR